MVSRAHDVDAVLRLAEVVLVVPPFAWIDRPSLGLHLLQGIARRLGFEVQVLYANLLFAACFDEGTHATLCRIGHGMFLPERMFARAAYGTPPLGRDAGQAIVPKLAELRDKYARAELKFTPTVQLFLDLEAKIAPWIDTFAASLARYGVVGCTTSFEQNAAAIAILRRIKQLAPATVTLLGGANCEGAMAEGILTLTDAVDHVFSGESEETFAKFLLGRARPRIYAGTPVLLLDELPTPDYADYYTQLAAFLPGSMLHKKGFTCLTYETSRGCWWGEKSHCTFCGLNGEGMRFRAKSADRVIEELQQLLPAHPVADTSDLRIAAGGTLQGARAHSTKLVTLTDNIMPHAYFRTLLPRLKDEVPGVTLMYEEKANLTLQQCRDLVRAGITEIQPGIEALSTGLLRLMAKGTTAAQNIALLRYARVTGLYLYWNLLYGFPGDEVGFYRETLELMPLLAHLQPPVAACPVIFDRFSPYFDRPAQYQIADLRPLPYYAEVLPDTAAISQIAYHFEGTCTTVLRDSPELAGELGRGIAQWRQQYHREPKPELTVRRLDRERFELIDTRKLASVPELQLIDKARAAMALEPCPIHRASRSSYEWALKSRVVIERDGKYIPLAVADFELMSEFGSRYHRSVDGLLHLPISP